MSASNQQSPAVLFDIDGTLVESNYLHAHAWARAFREVDIPTESWRIHRSIDMVPGGREVLEGVADLGLQVVLATSCRSSGRCSTGRVLSPR